MDQSKILIKNANIVTMDPNNSVYHSNNGMIFICNDKIEFLGVSQDFYQKYRTDLEEFQNIKEIDAWIIPGLINTHVHSSQHLGRGIADDVNLITWLHEVAIALYILLNI